MEWRKTVVGKYKYWNINTEIYTYTHTNTQTSICLLRNVNYIAIQVIKHFCIGSTNFKDILKAGYINIFMHLFW